MTQVTALTWHNERALAGVVNLVAVLADNKYALGRALSEWAVGAPTLENSIGCAAIAQEELGHSRTLYPLLSELPWTGGPAPLERGAERDQRYSLSYLDSTPEMWPQMVAAHVLIDTGLLTLIESLLETPFENLRRRAARIQGEEQFHMQFAEGRVRELVATREGGVALQREVDRLLPEVLCWFGPPAEAGIEVLVADRHLRWNSDRMRQEYLGRVGPLLLEVGVVIPATWDLASRSWEIEELPWQTWDGLHRRLDRPPTTIP